MYAGRHCIGFLEEENESYPSPLVVNTLFVTVLPRATRSARASHAGTVTSNNVEYREAASPSDRGWIWRGLETIRCAGIYD